MRLNLIYAQAHGGVIGKNNAMPWHLPQDLAHFRRHTSGCPVIMGRHTWLSLPPAFRPLPKRVNIVLSRQAQTLRHDPLYAGAQLCASLDEALAACQSLPTQPAEVWVIGGAQIYAQALPLAQRAVVTFIDAHFDGDAFAPQLGPEWRETERESHPDATPHPHDFVIYERQP